MPDSEKAVLAWHRTARARQLWLTNSCSHRPLEARTSKPRQTWKMPSTAWMWLRKALPSPSPAAAPLHAHPDDTRQVGTNLLGTVIGRCC